MQAKYTIGKYPFLAELGLTEINKGCYRNGEWVGRGQTVTSVNPSTNEAIAQVLCASEADYQECMFSMEQEKTRWQTTPAPVRGEIVREIGNELRLKKNALGLLVSLEMGKIKSEGLGEIQEFIDICDMACGMSRTIDGKILNSERPGHFMMEQWNPIGHVGVITAFNFPAAVCGWNAAISFICGD
jgi:aldehyde dehydrogenase family 7 protein A1